MRCQATQAQQLESRDYDESTTAIQHHNSSTLLDSSTARHRSRQNSTDLDTPALPRRMQSASTCLDGLDSYSKELLDSYSTGSTGKALTAPRQWPRAAGSTEPRDSSTARQPGLKALLTLLSMLPSISRTNLDFRDPVGPSPVLRPLCTTPFSFAVPSCPLSRGRSRHN